MDFEREDAERVLPNLVIAKRLRRYLCHCVHLNSFLWGMRLLCFMACSTNYLFLWGMRGITETTGACRICMKRGDAPFCFMACSTSGFQRLCYKPRATALLSLAVRILAMKSL